MTAASSRAKVALLLLLALQIGCQPLLMGWFARQTTDVRLCVGVVEMLKLGLAVVPLALSGQLGRELRGWRLATAAQTTAVPAFIYVLQNYLNQTAVVLLDGVTFNVLNQTKIIWTAALVYWMLGRAQSRVQVLALAILCAAAVVMTLPTSASASAHGSSNDSEGDSESRELEADAAFISGVYQALTAAVLSALAGTIIQRALQMQKRNAYMVTIELSVLGQLTLAAWALGSSLWPPASEPKAHSGAVVTDSLLNGTGERAAPGMWAGWTPMTFVALLCQAFGGVMVGFVIKHCGNVQKSFAVVLGMLISAGLEHVCNGKPFGVEMVAAVGMVALSTFLYVSNPPKDGGVEVVDVDMDKIDPQPRLYCVTSRLSCVRPMKKARTSAYATVSTEEDEEEAVKTTKTVATVKNASAPNTCSIQASDAVV